MSQSELEISSWSNGSEAGSSGPPTRKACQALENLQTWTASVNSAAPKDQKQLFARMDLEDMKAFQTVARGSVADSLRIQNLQELRRFALEPTNWDADRWSMTSTRGNMVQKMRAILDRGLFHAESKREALIEELREYMSDPSHTASDIVRCVLLRDMLNEATIGLGNEAFGPKMPSDIDREAGAMAVMPKASRRQIDLYKTRFPAATALIEFDKLLERHYDGTNALHVAALSALDRVRECEAEIKEETMDRTGLSEQQANELLSVQYGTGTEWPKNWRDVTFDQTSDQGKESETSLPIGNNHLSMVTWIIKKFCESKQDAKLLATRPTMRALLDFAAEPGVIAEMEKEFGQTESFLYRQQDSQ